VREEAEDGMDTLLVSMKVRHEQDVKLIMAAN